MRSLPFCRDSLLPALAGLCLGVPALAQVEVVLLANPHVPGSIKSEVPGGLEGVDDARFTNFNNKIYRTPTSGLWHVVATTNGTPTSADQVLVQGSGHGASVLAREGVTSIGEHPTSGATEFINFSSLSTPRINDAGQWAVGFRLGGGTAADDRLVKWTGSGFEVLRGGDAAPGGGTYFGSFNGANIANDGTVGYLAALAVDAHAGAESAFIGSTLAIQLWVDGPTPLGMRPFLVWNDLSANGFFQDATGMHSIVTGSLSGLGGGEVVAVNGAVVAQETVELPGFGSPVDSFQSSDGVWMESDGTWFVIGANADGQRWVLRDGVVIARSGDPITPGSSQTWETFRSARGDNNGHWIINGNASGDTFTDDVIVLDGESVIARESDPVDLDNDGAFDDSLYLHLIQQHGVLLDDGFVYFASRLKDSPTATGGAGGSNAASLVRARAYTPNTAVCATSDFNGDSAFGQDDDIEAFFLCLGGSCCPTCWVNGADFNGDGASGQDSDIESFFLVLGGGDCV